mgnify:CR=1 FL=1
MTNDLIPKINGKTIRVKDFKTFDLSDKKVFEELRKVYDKEASTEAKRLQLIKVIK